MTNRYPEMHGGEFGRSMHEDEYPQEDHDPLEGFDRDPMIEDDIDAEKPAFLEDDWRLPGEAPRAEWFDEDSEDLDKAA